MVVAKRDAVKTEVNNKYNCVPIRLCFINVYTYTNPKPTLGFVLGLLACVEIMHNALLLN